MSKKQKGAAARAWAKVSKEIRDGVIANLEFDASNSEDAGPFGGEPTDDEKAEAKLRSHAFRLAAQVLRRVAQSYATPHLEALHHREEEMEIQGELGAPTGRPRAGSGA